VTGRRAASFLNRRFLNAVTRRIDRLNSELKEIDRQVDRSRDSGLWEECVSVCGSIAGDEIAALSTAYNRQYNSIWRP
jgi:hypothetical protein